MKRKTKVLIAKTGRITRRISIGIRLFMLTLAAAVVSLGVYVYSLNPNDYKDTIITEISKNTGLAFNVVGEISWKISFHPVIVFENVSVESEGIYAKIPKLSTKLNIISLIIDKLEIAQVAAFDLDLKVETDKIKKSESKLSKKESNPERILSEIPARELILSNPKFDIDGKVFNPDFLRAKISKGFTSDTANLKIIKGRDVFDFNALVAELNYARQIYPIHITAQGFGTDFTADFALEGTSLIPIDFKVKGTITDAKNLADNFSVDMPKIMPLDIVLNGGFGRQDFTIKKLEIKSIDPRVKSNLSAIGNIDWNKIPKIDLSLKSTGLILTEILPDIYGRGWVKPKRHLNVFKDIPLPVGVLDSFDINLKTDFGDFIVYKGLNIGNAKLNLNWKDKKGTLSGDVSIGGGDASIILDGHIDNGKLATTFGGTLKGFKISELLREIGHGDLLGGLPANAKFVFRAKGKNLTEIMETITGRIKLRSTSGGTAWEKVVSNIYGKDFLTSLGGDLKSIFGGKKTENKVDIFCVAANLKVRNGVVETAKGLSLESDLFFINMAGKVDLGKEKLNVSMTSKPASGLRLSITGDLVSLMEFDGSLAEPELGLSGSGVLSMSATAGAGVALGLVLTPFTGGASLLGGAAIGWLGTNFITSWLSDNNPCRTAYEDDSAPGQKGDSEILNNPIDRSLDMLGQK